MDGLSWTKDKNAYLPLPNFLTIKQSSIHGLGLFTSEDISTGLIIGVSHVEDDRFPHGYIRTPLGAFINYSVSPNCTFVTDNDFIKLKALKKISSGDELTADYAPWYDEKTLAEFR